MKRRTYVTFSYYSICCSIIIIHGAIAKQGLTCVATALYWKGQVVKCEIALAKGKKQHDKRATEKERDWGREKQRVVRLDNR